MFQNTVGSKKCDLQKRGGLSRHENAVNNEESLDNVHKVMPRTRESKGIEQRAGLIDGCRMQLRIMYSPLYSVIFAPTMLGLPKICTCSPYLPAETSNDVLGILSQYTQCSSVVKDRM